MGLYDDQDQSALDAVRAALVLKDSYAQYLTVLGENLNVPRPPDAREDDELYRAVIQVLGWLPRNRMLTPHLLAEAIFGTRASLIAAGTPAWDFYVVTPNELVFECPHQLLTASNLNASYMHGYHGNAYAVGGPTDTVFTVGENAALSVTSLIGYVMYILLTGVWVPYTILAHSYNAGTQTNTFTLDAATVPTTSAVPAVVDLAAGVAGGTFTGDYMAATAAEAASGVVPPTLPIADRTYLYGQGLLDVFIFYMDLVLTAGVVLRTVVL